jgi:hypothetical protein
MLDKTELGLELLAMQTLMATMDSIQPHRIALKSRVLLESPKVLTLNQYLCAMSRPDMSNIIREVFIRDGNGEMQRVRAFFDCSATSIFVTKTSKTA